VDTDFIFTISETESAAVLHHLFNVSDKTVCPITISCTILRATEICDYVVSISASYFGKPEILDPEVVYTMVNYLTYVWEVSGFNIECYSLVSLIVSVIHSLDKCWINFFIKG
jgi:hypothetical protein